MTMARAKGHGPGQGKQERRYRVRNYRIICQVRQRQLIVLVIDVGHRSAIYEK